MYFGIHAKYTLFWSDFNFLNRFFKNTQLSDFMTIHLAGTTLFHADGQADMMKLTVTCRNFVNAPKSEILVSPLIKCRSSWDQTLDFVKI